MACVPPDSEEAVRRIGNVRAVQRGPVAPAAESDGQDLALGTRAWNHLIAPIPTQGLPPGTPLVGDAVLAETPVQTRQSTGLTSAAPGQDQTSEFMLGTVAVGVILPESTGTGDGWEDWSNEDLAHPGQDRRQLVFDEIQQGLDWWVNKGQSCCDITYEVTFVYETHLEGVSTQYEPIQMMGVGSGVEPWAIEVFGQLGDYTGGATSAARAYINGLRDREHSDWAFAILVVDSLRDEDGKFADEVVAWAYYGGPYVLMSYDNGGYTVGGMNYVTSHETGHIFLAADEYCDPPSRYHCDFLYYGYLNEYNGNCEHENPTSEWCIMRHNEKHLCNYTEHQVGWRDGNASYVPDPMDNDVVNTLYPHGTPTCAVTGHAYNVPWPSVTRPPVTINKIACVRYRVDEGSWQDARASDGAFDEDAEDYTFTVNAGIGTHHIETQAVSSVGRISNTASQDILVDHDGHTIAGYWFMEDHLTRDWLDQTVMSGFPGSSSVHDDGYSGRVPCGWSGTITPSHYGYLYDPDCHSYQDVRQDYLSGGFWVHGRLCWISGRVVDTVGSGVPGVVLTWWYYGPVISGPDGSYQGPAQFSQLVTVWPTLEGYTFELPRRFYQIQGDYLGQDFLAIPVQQPVISGYVRDVAGNGVAGVVINGLPDDPVTGTDGHYAATVPDNWSGDAEPVKEACDFCPPSRTYTAITSSLSGEDYVLTSISARAEIAGAKGRGDGAEVRTTGVVTCALSDCFYIEDEQRLAGIRVTPPPQSPAPAIGARAVVAGSMRGGAVERYIEAASVWPNGTGLIRPLGMTVRSLGGGDWRYDAGTGAGQKGVAAGQGLNNIGLRVKTWGKVTPIDSASFYLDDGSSTPARIVLSQGTGAPEAGTSVSVTGISSCYQSGQALLAQVLAAEIETAESQPEQDFQLPSGGSIRMRYVPAGDFPMGNSGIGGDLQFGPANEKPQHNVHLSGYWIGKYEVTRGDYRQFIDAGGYSNPAYWSADGLIWKSINSRTQPGYWPAQQTWGSPPGTFTQGDTHPVVGVTYYEAEAFCTWAGGHLPTEAQWEKAARWNAAGIHPNVYPWGDTWDAQKCNNWYDNVYPSYQTSPKGSYPSSASPYGCAGMAGNVWEWCKDWYSGSYYSQTPSGGWIDPEGPSSGEYRVMRGASAKLQKSVCEFWAVV